MLFTRGIRLHSTLKDTAVRRLRRKNKALEFGNDGPSFESFVFKGQVLEVYRSMLRDVGQLTDPVQKREVRNVLKSEFKSCMSVKDMDTKRSLLVGGIRNWRSVANNMGLSV